MTTVDNLPMPEIRAQTHIAVDSPNRTAGDPQGRHSKQARPAEPCHRPTTAEDPSISRPATAGTSPVITVAGQPRHLQSLFMGVLKREEGG
ncbi:hypothetical protein FH972_001868 [Carpinus fangiana]|uniref:Uncharacterized protein n=1 Tax=Carpinus fangiana TaxID=176857 RepID=A0A5N6QFQ9_9ROSI|nr:hypothetical protein FH972_001868 [Carpinus fangiana]